MHYELLTDCFSRPLLLVRNETEKKPDEEFYFDFGDGVTSSLSEVVHHYEQDGHYTIKLIGIKEGCAYQTAIDLPIFLIKVPNAITPEDSPGYNDTFFIQYGADGSAPFNHNIPVSLKVFNRWGYKVYESADYRNNWSGQGLAAGIYFYELRIGAESVCKGFVHVIK